MSPWWLLLVLVLIWLLAVLVARRRSYGRHRGGSYRGESLGQRLRDWWVYRKARRR